MYERVRGRVDRYLDSGDAQAVLDPAALDEAFALLDAVDGDPAVNHVVGLLFLFRHFASGAARVTRDLRRAAALLVPLGRGVPPHVLEQLRRVGTTAEEWHDQGLDLFADGYPEEAVEALQDAVDEAEPNSPEQLAYLQNLYVVLHSLDRDVVELVALGNSIVEAANGNFADYLPIAAVFGGDLHRCHTLTGDLAVLDQAVGMLRHAAELLPNSDPNKVAAASDLCASLVDLFEATGNVAALEEAVSVGRRAVAGLSESEHNYPALLSATADASLKLGLRTGAWSRVSEAVALWRRALALLAPDDPQRAIMLTNLVAGLMEDAYSGPQGLGEAVEFADEAVRAARDPEVRAVALANFSEVQRLLYEVTHDELALRRAVESGEQTHALTGRGVPLALAERRLFDRTGDLAHLDRAIGLLREAAEGRDATALRLLSNALGIRHENTGDTVALDEAVETARRAVAVLPEGHAALPEHLSTLGTALLSRYDRTGVGPVLADAVEAFRAAVSAVPPTHPNRVGMLRNLADALARATEFDEAVALLREAVALADPGSAEESSFWNNLAVELRMRFERTGDSASLDEAIALLRKATNAAPVTSAVRAIRLSNLASALVLRSGREAEAAALFEEAARSNVSRPRYRIGDAWEWGRTWAAIGDWAGAVDGYAFAVGLLPQVAAQGLVRRDQEHGLGQFDGLASEAAACALNAGDPAMAVQLLEQGRGILIARQLDASADLETLRSRHPHLADELHRIRQRLQQAPAPDEGAWLTGEARRADQRHSADREWERLVMHIRTLPGFADFLRVPALDALRAEATAGPVVLINVSRHRGDALVLTGAGVDVVALPGLTPDAVARRATEFHHALRVARIPGPDEKPAQDTISEVLRWLWDVVASPVLDRLGAARRVWWSPTGLLAFLPLHAAGHHDLPGRSVLDRVISSYTPTIRALRHARSRAATPTASGLLAVAMPQTPGAAPLPRSRREIDGLDAAVQLVGPDATAERVRAEMTRHARVHFACHGISDQDEPSAGRLLLHDHLVDPLTVQSIARLDLTGARFAYLSACETSQGTEHLSDEAVHITSAFLLAGYPEVIGTLWPVNDRIASRMAQFVYNGLDDGGAAALHAAVLRCRAEYHETPSLWSAHIHTGV